jgi:lipoate-protein ligase A
LRRHCDAGRPVCENVRVNPSTPPPIQVSPLPPPLSIDRVDPAFEQAWNQQVLMQPVLKPAAHFWTYRAGAIVRGRSQRTGRSLVAAQGRADDLPLVDRDAGGGAVLVGPWMLSLSVALPLDDARVAGAAVADSYRWLGDAFVDALARHGICGEALPRERTVSAPAHLAWACFAGLAPWEVVAEGRKLVGFAQRRTRHGVLLVAGLLLATVPWRQMTSTLGRPATQAEELAASTIDAQALTGRPLDAGAFAATLAPAVPGLGRSD